MITTEETTATIGWEYVYPAPEPCRHDEPEPDDKPGRYDATTPGPVWDGEGL